VRAWLAHGKRSHNQRVHHVGVRVARPPDLGLCASCVHGRVLTGARSSFLRCGLADVDKRFPRYPSLPVLECTGFKNVETEAEGRREES
jgi:hypothetical protein